MDSEIKKQADLLFNDFGLNFTTAVNAFVRQALREKAIPFQIRAVNVLENNAPILSYGKTVMQDLQAEATDKGLDKMTLDEINAIIADSRRENRVGK